MERIIYKNDDGGVSIIIPAQEALDRYGIAAIATKDVPVGKPYKIIDSAEIPSDRSVRELWDVDVRDLDDGVGAESNEFKVQP